MTRKETSVNRQARHFPDCDKFQSDEGYLYEFYNKDEDSEPIGAQEWETEGC